MAAALCGCDPSRAARSGGGSARTAAPSPTSAGAPSSATVRPDSPSPGKPGDEHQTASIRPGSDGTPAGQHRRVGPDDADRLITIRYGGRLEVVPHARPGGWQVTGYTASILRLVGSPAPADSHTFSAIAVGEGQVSLTAGNGSPDTLTVRVRVVRDLIHVATPWENVTVRRGETANIR
jgi:hypothetical protein